MDTPIYKELGQAIEATGLGGKETLSWIRQQRTFNAEHFQIDGYTPGKPLPLEAPPALAATKGPDASAGRDMAPSISMAADRGAPRVGPAPATSVPSPVGARGSAATCRGVVTSRVRRWTGSDDSSDGGELTPVTVASRSNRAHDNVKERSGDGVPPSYWGVDE